MVNGFINSNTTPIVFGRSGVATVFLNATNVFAVLAAGTVVLVDHISASYISGTSVAVILEDAGGNDAFSFKVATGGQLQHTFRTPLRLNGIGLDTTVVGAGTILVNITYRVP